MVLIILAAAAQHWQTYSPNHSHLSVSNAGLTSPAKPKCPVKSDVTSGHRPSRKSCRNPCSPAWFGRQKQLGRVQSSSSGVAVAVCGMEEQCVCTAAAWDFSILKCTQAAAAIRWHRVRCSQGCVSDSQAVYRAQPSPPPPSADIL